MYSVLNHPGLMWDGTFSVRAALWFPLIRLMNCIVAMAPARRNSLIGYSRKLTSSGTTLS